MSQPEYRTLREFWPYYLSEHLNPVNRALHVVGSLGVLVLIGLAIGFRDPRYLIPAPFFGYGFAWIGHFVIEKNRPATFKYPLKSFLCDWIMLFKILTFRIGRDIAELNAAAKVVA